MRKATRFWLSVLGVAFAVGLPAVAAASPSQWAQSALTRPADGTTVTTAHVRVAGEFVLQRAAPTDEVVSARVSVRDDPTDSFHPADDCSLPGEQEIPSDGSDVDAEEDRLPFSASFRFDCNGRYSLTATGLSNTGEGESYSIERTVVVEALPEPVTSISVAVDEDGTASVYWGEPALTPDAVGYVVERAGPADDAAGLEEFEALRRVDLDTTVIDDSLDQPGVYGYRVRTVRNAISGEVLSGTAATATAEGTFVPPTTTTTTTTEPESAATSDGPRVGTAVPTSRAPRITAPPVPTTIDTGFGETLDYGSRRVTETVEVDDQSGLAGEELGAGQSIIQDEGEGTNMLLPAAGALVMLVWAGHLIYLNRLAREL